MKADINPSFFQHVGIQHHQQSFTVTSEASAGSEVLHLLDLIESLKPEWMKNPHRHCAAGYNPNVFFGEYSPRSIAICEGCPVQAQCLKYAMDNNEYGVWGGTTERQRARIRKHGYLPEDGRKTRGRRQTNS